MNHIRRILLGDLKVYLKPHLNHVRSNQQDSDFLEWIGGNITDLVEKFCKRESLIDSNFVSGMNQVFQTERFVQLTKRWIVEYFLDLFGVIDYLVRSESTQPLHLPDNPVTRFGVNEYQRRFQRLPDIHWKKEAFWLFRGIRVVTFVFITLGMALKNGLLFSSPRRFFKVMREAVWTFETNERFYHRGDFFVDSKILKKEDCLFFSRGIPSEPYRFKAYQQLPRTGYQYFNLAKLSITGKALFRRVIPRYGWQVPKVLIREVGSPNCSLFSSVYLYFALFSIPYERVFSRFKVNSELGHNFFSANHIAESIICQNYGTKYYLMHWSDHSVNIDRHLLSYFGCDKFLLWGSAHLLGVEGGEISEPFGYVFKDFILDVRKQRAETLRAMAIPLDKKILSCFDESFGGECKIREEDYVEFWQIILEFAQVHPDISVVVKPKDIVRLKNLSIKGREKVDHIITTLRRLSNAFILDETKWSYVQAIGIADVVLNLSMTSSATIALICGIPAFYYDRDRFIHPFALRLKNKLVFNDKEKIIEAISKVFSGKYDPLKLIPEFVMRSFDACRDDSALQRLRLLLAGEALSPLKKTMEDLNFGIIVQARMGSSRLPGKIMMPLADQPVLTHVIRRLQECKNVWKVIIATTEKEQDDTVAQLARSGWADVYRGSEDDVLSRYYEAALAYKFDVVIRVTSDCPLIDPDIIDAMIERFKYENSEGRRCDYLSNTLRRTFPRGLDVEIFTFDSLKRAYQSASAKPQREHVTPYIYQNPDSFILRDYLGNEDHSDLRWTLDESEDYRLLKRVYDELYGLQPRFGYKDVLNLMARYPELTSINAHISQKPVLNGQK